MIHVTVSTESCSSGKPAEMLSSTGGSASTNVMEIKRFKPCENSESDLVGVSAPSNASICVEACTSAEPTEPEVFETGKVLVTPFTPVQLSLLKIASTKVPKMCQKKSRERSVERKVVSDPPSLTVSICPKPKPASASADNSTVV